MIKSILTAKIINPSALSNYLVQNESLFSQSSNKINLLRQNNTNPIISCCVWWINVMFRVNLLIVACIFGSVASICWALCKYWVIVLFQGIVWIFIFIFGLVLWRWFKELWALASIYLTKCVTNLRERAIEASLGWWKSECHRFMALICC